MTTLAATRASLVHIARRTSRVAHEVEDLAHDVLESALRRGLSLDSDVFLRSLAGAARHHGAFLARSAGRRRARETVATEWGGDDLTARSGERVLALSDPDGYGIILSSGLTRGAATATPDASTPPPGRKGE